MEGWRLRMLPFYVDRISHLTLFRLQNCSLYNGVELFVKLSIPISPLLLGNFRSSTKNQLWFEWFLAHCASFIYIRSHIGLLWGACSSPGSLVGIWSLQVFQPQRLIWICRENPLVGLRSTAGCEGFLKWRIPTWSKVTFNEETSDFGVLHLVSSIWEMPLSVAHPYLRPSWMLKMHPRVSMGFPTWTKWHVTCWYNLDDSLGSPHDLGPPYGSVWKWRMPGMPQKTNIVMYV